MRLPAIIPGLIGMALASSAPASEPECVVLLHGAGARGIVMKRLEANLRRAGYRTVNITYPSRRVDFAKLATDFVPARLRQADIARAPKVHFVTHSMGGLVLRLHLARERPVNLGRVIMIGPPNHGTIAADRAGRNPFLRWFFGGNLRQMGTGEDALHRRLGPADYDLGIIAGTGVINPLYTRRFGGPNDGIVAVESTKLDGMRDFIILPYSHTMILFRRETSRQVLAYLRDGKFANRRVERAVPGAFADSCPPPSAKRPETGRSTFPRPVISPAPPAAP